LPGTFFSFGFGMLLILVNKRFNEVILKSTSEVRNAGSSLNLRASCLVTDSSIHFLRSAILSSTSYLWVSLIQGFLSARSLVSSSSSSRRRCASEITLERFLCSSFKYLRREKVLSSSSNLALYSRYEANSPSPSSSHSSDVERLERMPS